MLVIWSLVSIVYTLFQCLFLAAGPALIVSTVVCCGTTERRAGIWTCLLSVVPRSFPTCFLHHSQVRDVIDVDVVSQLYFGSEASVSNERRMFETLHAVMEQTR